MTKQVITELLELVVYLMFGMTNGNQPLLLLSVVKLMYQNYL